MARYCKQYTNTDCGPTAVLNALKWAGYGLTQKKGYKRLRKKCEWSKGSPTYLSVLKEVLKGYKKVSVKQKKSPTLESLDSLIDTGKSFILLYTYKDGKKDSGHFVFGFGKDTRHYLVHNDTMKNPKKRLTRKKMNKYLRRRTRNGEAWEPLLLEISKR